MTALKLQFVHDPKILTLKIFNIRFKLAYAFE